jgi:hypothetical protein
MKRIAEDDITMRRYLLGQLPPEEQGEIEERLFLDGEYFQQLRMVEDELIDDYVYEELLADERERFDSYFLATFEKHESLRIARALKKYTSENTASVPSAVTGEKHFTIPSGITFLQSLRPRNLMPRLSLAAVILLILFVGVWLLIRAIRPPGNREPLQAQQPQQQEQTTRGQPDERREEEHRAETDANRRREPEQNDGQRNLDRSVIARDGDNRPANSSGRTKQDRGTTSPTRKQPVQVYSFLLLPLGQVREGGGGDVNKIDLPANAGEANLQIPLIEETGYISYRVTLNRPDGSSVQTWAGLKPTTAESGKIVSVRVPSGLLRQEKYQIKLSGVTADGNVRTIGIYPFQVTRK